MGYADRTTLNNLTPNLDIGDVADPALRLAVFQYLFNLSDTNYAYLQSLVTSGTLSPLPPDFLYRQALINGNFDIWQRGSSFSSNGYTADRWGVYLGAGGSGTTSIQSASVGNTFTPFEHFLRHDQSIAASDQPTMSQKIEDVRTFAGKTASIIIRAKSGGAGPYAVNVYGIQHFGTGGSPSAATVTSFGVINITSAEQDFTLSAAIPSIAGKVLGTNDDDRLEIQLNFPSGAIFTFDFAYLGINAGDVALPFQPRSAPEESLLAKRFNFRLKASAPYTSFGVGQAISATTALVTIPLPVSMRVVPALTYGGSLRLISNSATSLAVTSITMGDSSPDVIQLSVNVASGLTGGDAVILTSNGDGNAFLNLDADF